MTVSAASSVYANEEFATLYAIAIKPMNAAEMNKVRRADLEAVPAYLRIEVPQFLDTIADNSGATVSESGGDLFVGTLCLHLCIFDDARPRCSKLIEKFGLAFSVTGSG